MSTNRYVVGDLDIRQEFKRLRKLNAFQSPLIRDLDLHPPELKVSRFNRRVRKQGGARGGFEIKLNIGTTVDRYDTQETLLHELAHIFAQRRWSWSEGHSERFWRVLDEAFQEAYGPLTVAPRSNRYHGRYATALRQQARDRAAQGTVDQIDRLLEELQVNDQELGWYPERIPGYFTDPDVPRELTTAETQFLAGVTPEPYERTPVIDTARLPEPLKTFTQGDEPSSQLFGGPARVRQTYPTTRGTAVERDERVYAIIEESVGLTRQDIDQEYARRHGTYPGASTYNSIWRLRRAGLVVKAQSVWYIA